MTMTRVWLVCIEAGHVAFTSQSAAARAGYPRARPVLLLDGPIVSVRKRMGARRGRGARYVYQPLAGHSASGLGSEP